MDELIPWLNSIDWKTEAEITPAAERLIAEHVRRIKPILQHLMIRSGQVAGDAHNDTLAAGHNTSQHRDLMDRLFREAKFAGAGVREPMILLLTSCYCWELDDLFSQFSNPWEPLVDLMGMGYPVSFDESSDRSSIDVMVGSMDRIMKYHVM